MFLQTRYELHVIIKGENVWAHSPFLKKRVCLSQKMSFKVNLTISIVKWRILDGLILDLDL